MLAAGHELQQHRVIVSKELKSSIARYKLLEKQLDAKIDALANLVLPLATSVTACDDLIRLVAPGYGPVGITLRELRKNMKNRQISQRSQRHR